MSKIWRPGLVALINWLELESIKKNDDTITIQQKVANDFIMKLK